MQNGPIGFSPDTTTFKTSARTHVLYKLGAKKKGMSNASEPRNDHIRIEQHPSVSNSVTFGSPIAILMIHSNAQESCEVLFLSLSVVYTLLCLLSPPVLRMNEAS